MTMEFKAATKSGQEVTIEVFYDQQAGVEPGWCWRGKGEDATVAGGDTIDDVDQTDAAFALQCAKGAWGVA